MIEVKLKIKLILTQMGTCAATLSSLNKVPVQLQQKLIFKVGVADATDVALDLFPLRRYLLCSPHSRPA